MTDPLVLSITEVRNALRCPRVFTLGRLVSRPVRFPVGTSSLGALFHRIAGKLASSSAKPPLYFVALPAGADASQSGAALSRWMLSMLREELQQNASYVSMPAEVDDLAEALRQFADYLAARIAKEEDKPAVCLQRLFHESELDLRVALPTLEIELTGRIDAIFAGKEPEVVEYKLSEDGDEALDRVQVALYRWLLRLGKNLAAVPLVLRFTPQLIASRIGSELAEQLVEQRVLPLLEQMKRWNVAPESAPAPVRTELCAVCPLRAECVRVYPDWLSARDAPPAGAARPRPLPDGNVPSTAERPVPLSPTEIEDAEGRKEAALCKERVLAVLEQLGISASAPKAAVVGPRTSSFEVALARGFVTKLDKAANSVEHRMITEHGVRVEYESTGGRRLFHVVRKHPRPVVLGRLLALKAQWLQDRAGRFVLGETSEGAVLTGDLSQPGSAHLLVAGMTGSGKSVLLRSLAASMAHFHPPSALRFTLVDPKRVSFLKLAGVLAAHLSHPLLHELSSVLSVLEDLAEEMTERYQRFADKQVQDLEEYNEVVRVHERLPRRVLFIDEFQDLLARKEEGKEFLSLIARLGTTARAAGIHLILATQRPDRQTVPGEIKSNLQGRIALKVPDQVSSRIILDQGGAERLLGAGDLLAELGHGIARAQAPSER